MSRRTILPSLAALLVMTGCSASNAKPCTDNSECVQGGILGVCIDNAADDQRYCAFKDESCSGDLRWGVLAPDDLASECVDNLAADADASPGMDAPPETPDAGPDAAPGAWSPPSLVENVSTTETEFAPSLSANGLELYYVCFGANIGDICVATRSSTSEKFSAGQPIVVLNTTANELDPDISSDGLELFFERYPGIYVTKRATLASAWGSPAVVPGIDGRFPSISSDGLTLYVTVGSCEPACLSKTTRATRSSPWGPLEAVKLPGNLKGYDVADISADGLQLLVGGGSTTQASILLIKRPNTSADWATVESIPNLSFDRNNKQPSWGFNDREIYLTRKVAPPVGVGKEDIFVSALQ